MSHRYPRTKTWAWNHTCTCCKQFEIDQAKKLETRAKRAARRAAQPQNPPPETVQVVTVPVISPSLQSIINRQMNYYYGYGSGYGRPTHDLYGCQLTEGSYNPWNSTRNWEE